MIKAVSQALAKKENGEKGFTLIELLVVVIIIGILAAVAIPVFLNMREGAWRSSAESDAKNAAITLESLATQNNGAVPAGAGGATALVTGPHYWGGTAWDGTAADNEGAITVSPDNSVLITVTGNAYTVAVENGQLPEDNDTYTYDSSTGAGAWGAGS